MATLTGNQVKDTYRSLLKLEDNGSLSANLKIVQDGIGNSTPLSLSTTAINSSVNVEAPGFKTPGGTSAQFLKADGSVDTNTYITSVVSTDTLDSVTDRGNSTPNSITVGGLFSGSVVTDTLEVQFGLLDATNSKGSNGQVLSSTGTWTEWIDNPQVSLTGAGATSIAGTFPNFTISSTDNNTDTTYTAGNGLNLSGTQFSHSDTSSQASVNNSGNTVIQDVTVDTYGHVTGLTSKALTLASLGYTGSTSANNYTHPTYAGDDISVDTGALTGATVVSDIDFNITTDTQGHVTDANGVVATRTLTLANLGYTGATNANYITNNNQLTNGAGYTTNVGDITGVTAGNGLTGGGSSGSVTLNVVGANGLTVSADAITLDNDLRGHAWLIGRDNNDYINVSTDLIDFALDGAIDMRLLNSGTLHVEGDVVAYSTTISDSRLKDNVKTIEGALDKVEKLRGVEYDWKKGNRKGQHEIGLIAQEVEEVFPFLIHEHELVTGEFENDDTVYKTVDYEKLVGLLIESVKELSAKVKTLENK